MYFYNLRNSKYTKTVYWGWKKTASTIEGRFSEIVHETLLKNRQVWSYFSRICYFRTVLITTLTNVIILHDFCTALWMSIFMNEIPWLNKEWWWWWRRRLCSISHKRYTVSYRFLFFFVGCHSISGNSCEKWRRSLYGVRWEWGGSYQGIGVSFYGVYEWWRRQCENYDGNWNHFFTLVYISSSSSTSCYLLKFLSTTFL